MRLLLEQYHSHCRLCSCFTDVCDGCACTASVRSSSHASSSSCTSSIAEEESEEISETSDHVAMGGEVFVPPRPVTARKAVQQQRRRAAEDILQRKPVLKPSTAERRVQYQPKSPRTVAREPPSSSAPGWRTRPQPDKRPEAGPSFADGGGSTTPASRGIFKVPATPPVPSSGDAGSRIPRMMPTGDDRRGADGVSRPTTATGSSTESAIPRAATPPPPQKLHSSSSDLALSGSGSSTRTQSRIPTRTGSRRGKKDTAATSSRASSPGSTK